MKVRNTTIETEAARSGSEFIGKDSRKSSFSYGTPPDQARLMGKLLM